MRFGCSMKPSPRVSEKKLTGEFPTITEQQLSKKSKATKLIIGVSNSLAIRIKFGIPNVSLCRDLHLIARDKEEEEIFPKEPATRSGTRCAFGAPASV